MTLKTTVATIAMTATALYGMQAKADPAPEPGAGDGWTTAIIRIENEEEAASLEEQGVVILRRRGDLLLTFIPPRENERMRKSGHEGVYFGRPIVRTLDKGIPRFGGDKVLSGDGLPQPFTGKGVVTGICDIGIDPMHVNFIGPDGGNRIRRIVEYKESRGVRRVVEPHEYAVWRTDTTFEYHATHVAGILAGSCNEAGYGGIACESDIVVTTSEESDVALLCGVEDILDYAREHGKRAVVNLSMGSYLGPHDGTSLFCQYMDMLGEEAIICMSSGNEGSHKNHLACDLTEEKDKVRFRLGDRSWHQFDIYGATELWCSDSSPLELCVSVYDGATGSVVTSTPVFSLADGGSVTVSSAEGSEFSGVLSPYMKGFLTLYGGVSPENGRFCATLEYDLSTTEKRDGKNYARYEIAVEAKGVPGAHVDVYADGIYTRLMGMSGSPSPDTDGSMSDLATGHNVVSVGMYGNRATVPLLSGGEADSGYEDGGVVEPSSYATLIDGRVMPLTVAPGAVLISSCSTPFLEDNPSFMSDVNAETRDDEGNSHYWIASSGTSMSSPYVAGFLATWVEAWPELTVDDVKRVIASTNEHDIPDPDNPRHGGGWFSPYKGLMEVLRMASVADPDVLDTAVRIMYSDGKLSVFNPGGNELEYRVVSVSGTAVRRGTAKADLEEIGLDGLAPGVYVAYAGGRSLKFIVR